MDEESLRVYLLKVAREGYADRETERQWTKEPNGSTTITHSDGDWSMHDNFFGGEPYGGREVVFYRAKPVWMMVYYGAVDPRATDVRAVYACLQDALARRDEATPLRGPREFVQGEFRYETNWDGGIRSFSGTERILRHGDEVYAASYAGGLVDVRAE